MVAIISFGSCPMCEIPTGVLNGHSTGPPLDCSRYQHGYLELLEDTNVDARHTLGVHSIHYRFWQYPICTVYPLLQPAQLHQLLLGLVKDISHWLFNYLKSRNVKDQFDN